MPGLLTSQCWSESSMIVSGTSCHPECPAPAESPPSRQWSEPGLEWGNITRETLTLCPAETHLRRFRTWYPPGPSARRGSRSRQHRPRCSSWKPANIATQLWKFLQEFCAWNKISWNIARMESWNWIYFKLPRYLFWRYTISRQSPSLKDLGLNNTMSACPAQTQTSSRLPGAWLIAILWFLFIAQCTGLQLWLLGPVCIPGHILAISRLTHDSPSEQSGPPWSSWCAASRPPRTQPPTRWTPS